MRASTESGKHRERAIGGDCEGRANQPGEPMRRDKAFAAATTRFA